MKAERDPDAEFKEDGEAYTPNVKRACILALETVSVFKQLAVAQVKEVTAPTITQ